MGETVSLAGLKVLVTGSSAFDINKYTGEPLTGRKKTFNLYALSEQELETTKLKPSTCNLVQKDNSLQALLVCRYWLVIGDY